MSNGNSDSVDTRAFSSCIVRNDSFTDHASTAYRYTVPITLPLFRDLRQAGFRGGEGGLRGFSQHSSGVKRL